MAVPEQIPVVNYVADGVVKKFDVPFEYDQQSDLHLYVDGVEPTVDKYFFADNAFNFYIAPTIGQGVKIKRITPKERDTDYDLHTNTVRPKALNSDFDRLWYVLQEVFSDVGGLSQAVQDEIIARIQGDEDLLNQLTAEISARMLGDEAVTQDLKNYVNQVVGAIINDPTFDGIDADKVNDASGETQQQVNYNGGSKWHSRVGGYRENERVVLANGDIVKSTVDGNVNDPNVDMTGWVNPEAEQKEINSDQVERNIEEVYVNWVLPDVKLAGDWNGATGTDDTAKLQQIIDSFGVKRVNLLFSEKRYRLDSARIDFKRVALIGKGTTDNGATGGTEFYIGNLGGLYSSIEDNQAPRQENIRITSASVRTQNGQTALDLTGLNYPNMENVTIYGSEKPLVLSGGTVVESHYGRFDNVNISRGYHALTVAGGNRTQTHNFFAGRIWDCVVGVKNRGTSDINFHGTAFESDQAFINSTEDGDVPETNIFGMRDECDLAPDNTPQGSTITYTGAYWSGWKKPREFSVDGSGEIKEHGKVMTSNVRGDMSILGHNLLRNPELKPDLSTNRPIGWTFPSSATEVTEVSLPRGRGWKWTRGVAFQAFEQNGVNLKKGRYMIGFTVDKFNSASSGAILLQLLDSSGVLPVKDLDVNVDFSSSNFTSISGVHLGSQVVREIIVLRDLTNVRFRAGINNMPVGQVGFFGQPFIVKGANFDKFYNVKDYAEEVQYSTTAPISVSHRAGQKVINPYPTSTNPVTEWIADSTTTWKPVKWVINSFTTASLPVLTAAYRGVEVFDTTTNTFKRWTGTAWI